MGLLALDNPGTSAEDEESIAARCSAPVLISAAGANIVSAVARRVHAARTHAAAPFVQVAASAFPHDQRAMARHLSRLTRRCAGGSMFVANVERMPCAAQDIFAEVLRQPSFSATHREVRLISGTTVNLFDRVTAGTFSEELFYRLNVIHVIVGQSPSAAVR